MHAASHLRIALLVAVALSLATVALHGQERQRGFGRRSAPVSADVDFEAFNVPYDGRLTFVRLRYTPDRASWGRGFFGADYQWDHDYPRAERHFTKILTELTSISVTLDASNILALDDPTLLQYPVAYMSEPGHWTQTDEEAASLRDYLLKGGFVIFDDFAEWQWFNFEEQLRRVLPDHRLVRLDASHPIFHSFYEIESLDGYVHPYRFLPSSFYGIFEDNDPNKRLLIIANYDNDIGESWEFSDTGLIPIDITNEAYKLGINYIVYAMTH
jgi:hypothetical protein